MALSRVGHFLAKALFIDTNYRKEPVGFTASRSNSIVADSTGTHLISSKGAFVEEEPTAWEWIQNNILPTKANVAKYVKSLFPFTAYILHYNFRWFLGDIIAGECWIQHV
jgi:sodium-independent sulfate anion transporter 11